MPKPSLLTRRPELSEGAVGKATMWFVVLSSTLCAAVATSIRAQGPGPGSGWMVVSSQERELKILYWDLFDKTEVWTSVVPRTTSNGQRIPVRLIFSATLNGKAPTLADSARLPIATDITVLAQSDPRAVLPARSYSLSLRTSDGRFFDLIKGGLATTVMPTCEACAAQAIAGRVGRQMFLAWAGSERIVADVLGFIGELDDADTKALADLARQLRWLP